MDAMEFLVLADKRLEDECIALEKRQHEIGVERHHLQKLMDDARYANGFLPLESSREDESIPGPFQGLPMRDVAIALINEAPKGALYLDEIISLAKNAGYPMQRVSLQSMLARKTSKGIFRSLGGGRWGLVQSSTEAPEADEGGGTNDESPGSA